MQLRVAGTLQYKFVPHASLTDPFYMRYLPFHLLHKFLYLIILALVPWAFSRVKTFYCVYDIYELTKQHVRNDTTDSTNQLAGLSLSQGLKSIKSMVQLSLKIVSFPN